MQRQISEFFFENFTNFNQNVIEFVETAIKELELDMPYAPRLLPAPLPRDIYDLENKFEKLEEELIQIKSSTNELRRNFLELNNLKQVLTKVQILFNEVYFN